MVYGICLAVNCFVQKQNFLLSGKLLSMTLRKIIIAFDDNEF